MNAIRRKTLERIEGLLSEARGLLEEVAQEERDAYENLPEGIQYSERGERMDEIASALEEAVNDIENIETVMEEARG